MANVLYKNFASGLLAVSISDTALSIQVGAGEGANFPSPTGNQYFLAALEDNAGNVEIVKIIDHPTTDVFTVDAAGRGFDNTTALAFTQNITRFELRLVAAVIEEIVQKNGDVMSGNLDFATNEVQNANLTGTTIVTGGQTVGTAIRGLLDTSTNELAVPVDGTSRATVGGVEILASGDDLIVELDTGGVIDLSSATVRVVIGDGTGAVLRIATTAGTEYIDISAAGTAAAIAATGLTDLDITGVNVVIGGASELSLTTGNFNMGTGDILMEDGAIARATMKDFAVTAQAVNAITSTAIDYELGNYVKLAMVANITLLTIDNPPTTEYGVVRFKITQDATGSRTIAAWPSGTVWPDGVTPTLSTAANAVDFVELWTDDGGTTWYGAADFDWK